MSDRKTGTFLREIYDRLLKAYGPQHWWPADEPFEVMVGAVLTQSTAWTNVEKAIDSLGSAGALNPVELRRLSLDGIAALVRSSGYYHVKSRKLKALVEWLGGHDDDLSELRKRDTAELRRELLGVYGIGEETADSILLYALNKPVFVIDAYTRRIIDRIGAAVEPRTYAGYQTLFAHSLPADAGLFNEYHALFVQHGKTTCRKAPRCPQCCLLGICQFGGGEGWRHPLGD
jgi:endonuclease-3 related protein